MSLVKVPQGWQSAEKGNEGEERDDQNDDGHVSEGPHVEGEQIWIISRSRTIHILDTVRLCLPFSVIPGVKSGDV